MAYEVESKQHWGLNLVIVLLVGVLFAVIMIPKQIWDEEEQYREESRTRMQNLWKVESAFLSLTGNYTELAENAITVVNAVYDSMADTLDYYGEQQLTLPPKTVQIQVNRQKIIEWVDSTLTDTAFSAFWSEAVNYYNSVATDDSTNSGQFARMVITAAYDSVKADTTWKGTQTITIPFVYNLQVPPNYTKMYDTTFVSTRRSQTVVEDTTFQVIIEVDTVTSEMDTSWIPVRDIEDMQERYPNMQMVDTSITRQTRWITETYPNPPTKEWAYCPLTGKPYILKVTGDNIQHLRVESPIEGEYSERRYVFFTFADTSHGYIEDGEVSWEE
ncbi:MAG: hypothetical protein MAGBODY4_01558 [Candidatus Marinimicrobia bacterium]|nr:hypothetical protein [Candidatus Neomarinimicrobiota bacterium]